MYAYLSRSDNDLSEFVQLFGNEEIMKERFPKSYQAYENTVAKEKNAPIFKTKERGVDHANSQTMDYVDIEITHVGYADAAKKVIQVELTANANSEAGYNLLYAKAVNARTYQEMTSNMDDEFVGNVQKVNLNLPMDGGVSLNNVIIVTSAYVIGNNVLKYDVVDSLSAYLLDYSGDFTIEHPIKTHEGETNNDINIAYITKGSFTNLCDYYYDSTQMKDKEFRIPSKGQIKVSGVTLQSIHGCTLSAQNGKFTKRFHLNAKATLLNSNTISWDIPANWGFPYKDILENTYEYVTYTLTIQANAQGQICTFTVTNEVGAIPTNTKCVMNRIYIYKDCFLKGTEISMAGGETKLIENIKAGDKVLSENNQSSTVTNVRLVKQTCMVAHVTMKDGKEVFTTSGHPFETNEGLRCAFLLHNGDVLKTMDGECAIEQVCISPEEEYEVYSITISGNSTKLYANGCLVGDSTTELTEFEKATNLRYQVPQEWRKDYDGWLERNREIEHERK